MDTTHTDGQAIPLVPDHGYDAPGGAHLGQAASLNVPCSDGPADLGDLDRDVDASALIEAEPRIEPNRMMEAGSEFDEETVQRLQPLFCPLREP